MANNSIRILERFSKFKYLNLNGIQNCKLDDLSFLKKNQNILKLNITNNKIWVTEINHLLKCRCSKNIDLEVIDSDGKSIKNCRIRILEGDNNAEITIPADRLEEISKKINLYKINKINVIVNNLVDKIYYIKLLKKYKKETNIIIKDFSCLKVEQAKKMKDILKLETIKIGNTAHIKDYDIDTYIEIRNQIDNIINKVSKHVSQPEKFLEIYKFLGDEFELVENEDSNFKAKTCTRDEVSQILQNCLQCMNIKSNIITGEELEGENEHSWNQVELEGKWYNVDLGLDIENIKKKKAEYCLLGDKNFIETHTPKAGKNNYCAEDFNPKLINVFFKTGLFKEKLLESYIEIFREKISKIFNLNKEEKILALPSGNIDETNKKQQKIEG